MFLHSGLFTYTLVTGNDILHKHFRMFVLLVVHDKDQTAVTIIVLREQWIGCLTIKLWGILWKCLLNELYLLCFGAVKDPEENNFCALGSELYNLRKFLKNKTHQVERLFHQKLMSRLFCLFALKGTRTSLQMQWGNINLKKLTSVLNI